MHVQYSTSKDDIAPELYHLWYKHIIFRLLLNILSDKYSMAGVILILVLMPSWATGTISIQ